MPTRPIPARTPTDAPRHRVVVLSDQRPWENCEGRGPRVVELTDDQLRRVEAGDAESVFRSASGLPVVDLLRDLRTVKASRPRPTPAPDPAPSDVGTPSAEHGRSPGASNSGPAWTPRGKKCPTSELAKR